MNEDQKKLLIFENYEINCFCPGSVIFHFFVGILKNIQAGFEKSNWTHTFQVFNFYLWLWYLIKGVGRVLFLLVDNIVEKVWICLDISSYKINVVKWNLHNSFKGGGIWALPIFPQGSGCSPLNNIIRTFDEKTEVFLQLLESLLISLQPNDVNVQCFNLDYFIKQNS